MPIVSSNIANNLNNYTRFLILAKTNNHKTGNDKTSIIFSIKHEPGSLFRIIEKFHKNNVNLTKIESRPTKTNTWEYNFYVDFEGHKEDSKISEMLEKIKRDTFVFENFRFLSFHETKLKSFRFSKRKTHTKSNNHHT